MKKTLFAAVLVSLGMSAFAQEAKEGFQFTTVKENPITSIKNQNQSGTCWAFSSLSFFESELLRMGKGEFDLCEMYLAHKTYEDRAKASVRMHGDISFSQGGSFYDAVYCMKHYGMIPQDAMPQPGTLYGDTLPNHNELFNIAEAYVNAVAKGSQKKLSPVWFNGLNAIYDSYLGVVPEKFTHNGKEYTPKTYMESLGLDMNDYVSLTSYTHHPFYEQFVIEVQDNWRWGLSYNLPLDEFMETMDYAVKNGFTFAWGSDVSETGFTRNGIAVCPDVKKGADLTGSDMARWTGLSATDRRNELTSRPLPEIEVTQEMRQEAYDNWETTDDHGMLIYGIAKDQNGKEYFMVKNSWGFSGKYKGIWYASKAFVAYKTMNILIHKDGIPKKIAKKLGL
ncbi:MAG: aminopeptidase [Bacteroidaceae bacterium]|jgi:aminopeptidase C|nr:aminopeptidase [Bacteroidaceae bacterium]